MDRRPNVLTEHAGEYFTVDRAGTLSLSSIELEQWDDLEPPELQAHVDKLFPDGLSRHGERYLLQAGSLGLALEPSMELLFEYVRRAMAPEAPSRFQSVFAFERLEDAQRFEAEFGEGVALWLVRSHVSPFRADMRWLSLAGSALIVSHAAVSYWLQADSAQVSQALRPRRPLWELLLPPPVDVIECVG